MKIQQLFIAILMAMPSIAFSQARLVINGAFINISQGAFLVIDNPAENAITRNSGHIISEGESNTIQWNIGTTAGNYMVPFGYDNTDYIPLSFHKTAGTGNGNFQFATYSTGWQNSAQLPTEVLNLNHQGVDNSAFVIDRFWKIDLQNYLENPVITDLTFTYIEEELTNPGNTITEANLQAQRWSGISDSWDDYAPAGTVNTTENMVTISASFAANDMFSWWTLTDNGSALPIELLTFEVNVLENEVHVAWATATEIDNDYFSLERSANGIQFNEIATVNGAGNSSTTLHYNYRDENPLKGVSYYRLKQIDYDGKFEYSPTIAVLFAPNESSNVSLYPNPVTERHFYININADNDELTQILLFDFTGNLIFRNTIDITSVRTSVRIEISLSQHLSPGVYILKVVNNRSQWQDKLIVM